jgi:hypothetical protein
LKPLKQLKQLEELIDLSEDHARRILIGFQESLMPTWLIVDSKGEGHIIGTPWQDVEQKKMVEHEIRQELKRYGATAYSVVFEAWRADAPKGWLPGTPLPVQPSNNPNRMEVVIAIAANPESVIWRMWRTKRNHLEQVCTLDKMDISQDLEGADSWMAGMFN